MILLLLFIGEIALAKAQTLVFLNTSFCAFTSQDCYSQNVDSYYVGLNLQNHSQQIQTIPSFTLDAQEMVVTFWSAPTTPCRYVGVSLYMYKKSDDTLVFAEISNPVTLQEIQNSCGFPSLDFIWGSTVRFVILSNTFALWELPVYLGCTILLPVPGKDALTNFSHLGERFTTPPTRFTWILRLTLPANQTTMMDYVTHLGNVSSITLWKSHTPWRNDAYSYPRFPVPWVSSAEQDWQWKFTFLIRQVRQAVLKAYPTALIRAQVQTMPWLNAIQLPEKGGYVCVNSSMNCQGATQNGNYFYSPAFVASTNVWLIVLGAIHHDFFPVSQYSSLTAYKLIKSSDISSGFGLCSLIDNDLRCSAIGYIPEDPHMPKFYATAWGYSKLDLLPSSTLQYQWNEKDVPLGTPLYFAARTYATTPIQTDSFLKEVVLEVVMP